MNLPLIPCVEADRIIQQNLGISSRTEEIVSITHAYDRILAEPMVADRNHPAYRRATMDGICFRANDTLDQISGCICAGDATPESWPYGNVCEIMTGAVVPDECDCLVPYEDYSVHVDPPRFRFTDPPSGKFIHEVGSDIAVGQTAVKPGTLIGPIELALAATFGYETITVRSRARVTLLTTGNELVPVSQSPKPWQIRMSHAEMLRPGIMAKAKSMRHRHVPDDEKSISAALEECLQDCDLLLITGGISRGKKDFIKDAVQPFRGPANFHGVAQRPGKPMAFWTGSPSIIALPGNPLSVFATFCRYVVPFLESFEGRPSSRFATTITQKIEPHESFQMLLPIRKTDDGNIESMNFSNSGNILASSSAFGIAAIPHRGHPTPSIYSIYPYYHKI